MRLFVIINTGSGTGPPPHAKPLHDQLDKVAAIQFVQSDQLLQTVREAVENPRCDAVVIGGGDGTLSTAATELIRSAKPMGVLPLGTMNHFARDLGIPDEISDAIRIVMEGHVTQVDVGEVNGRVFLNNVSLGVYAHALRQRDEARGQGRHGKFLARVKAIWEAFDHAPYYRVRVACEQGSLESRTQFLFVGNNVYELRVLDVGRRTRLDRGELCVYVSRQRSRRGMLVQAVRALMGRLEQAEDFESLCSATTVVEVDRREVTLAVDGEPIRMATPLRFRSRPRALRVIVPSAVAHEMAA